ncbi:MAG: hypothetical protein ACNA8W_12705 [Bradymonadaceae bacterium]
MLVALMDHLNTFPLSVARRLFALRRMAHIAEERGDIPLTVKIEEAIAFDQRTIQLNALRREYRRLAKAGSPGVERLVDITFEDVIAHREEGHHRFLSTVEHVLETYFAQSPGHIETRRVLLSPILVQVERLRAYHIRRATAAEAQPDAVMNA